MDYLIPKYPLKTGDNWVFSDIQDLIYELKNKENDLLQNSDLIKYKIQESDSILIIERLRSLIQEYISGKVLYKQIFKVFYIRRISLIVLLSTLSQTAAISQLICLDQATTSLKNEDQQSGILYLLLMLALSFLRTILQALVQKQKNLVMNQTKVIISFLVMAKQMRSQVMAQNKDDENPIANINNLLTEDLDYINLLIFCIETGWPTIYILILCLIFLVHIDSHAGFIITGALVASQLYHIMEMGLTFYLERKMLEKADLRVTLTTDVVEGIKQIKYLSWQQTFSDKIMSIRKQEFKFMLCKKFFDGLCEIFWQNLTYVLLYCYVMSLGQPLNQINVFTLIAVFNTMTFPMGILPWVVQYASIGYVSLKRVGQYLNIRELNHKNVMSLDYPANECAILISNSDLSWPKLYQKNSQATQVVDVETDFQISIAEMNIQQGTLNFLIGKVGSGKTALLNAILNELDKPESEASASFLSQSADRLLSISGQIMINGTIAYCSQSTWVQNISIRDNIIFGNEFDEKLYNEVIRVCQLQIDIDHFDKKDLYEVGPDGKRLSGGQKQRITIARSLYSNKDIYLFDDIFSSLDVHVADAIFQQAILEFLSKKTILLITSHYRYLEQAKTGKVFLIEQGCLVNDQDKVNSYLIDNRLTQTQSDELNTNIYIKELLPNLDQNMPSQNQDTTVIKDEEEDDNDEERETGKIAGSVWIQYFSYMGWAILILFLILSFASQLSLSIIDFWLKSELVGDEGSLHRITVYCDDSFGQAFLFLTLTSIVITVFRSAGYVAINIRSSWLMFKDLNRSIMFGLMKFFDRNNVGRIINRVQSDTFQVDDEQAWLFNVTAEATTKAFGLIIGLLILFPYLSVAIIIVIYLYWRVAQIYTNANRELKRLKSVNTGRLLSIMNETVNGIKVIRGFNKQEYIESVYISRLNDSILSEQCGERAKLWFNVRLMLLNNLLLVCLISFISILVVSGLSVDFAACALALTYSVVILDRCNEAFEFSLRTESGMVCVERILQYTKLESEDLYKGVTKPISQCQNAVEFKNICMSYEPQENGKFALNDVSFSIKKGEKVAFVGRTGSGKTSILNALFRLYEYQKGTVLIEGQISEEMSLKSLRDQLSVVPQFGFLFNATIKENIDPENLYDKQTIEDLFTKSDFKLRGATECNTDFIVQPNGTNLSNGEKQVLNFLRIISQDKQIICLDEATSNMDPQTDQLLHNLLFKYVENRTLLVITHRLENIQQYDKIIVMDKGKIVEMGSFQELSQNTNGFFNKLRNYVRYGKFNDLVNSNEDIPETTGKFGTGFITTHLLSRVICLESVYKDKDDLSGQTCYRKFQITLDRSARNLQQFIQEYDRLFQIFDDLNDDDECPIIDFQLGQMNTTFTYPLIDSHSINVMKQGLTNFSDTAAFVLAFNPRIKRIIVNENIYERKSEQVIQNNITQVTIVNGNTNDIKVIVLMKSRVVNLAFMVVQTDGAYYIQQKDPFFPGLFSDFPLIGSQKFIFPCVVNSHIFWPNEERSSIILQSSSRSKVNKQVLENAIQLILQFIKFTQTQNNWNGIENICKIKIPDQSDAEWYQKNLVSPFIDFVINCKIITATNGQKASLLQIVFPKIDGMKVKQAKQLFDIITAYYSIKLIEYDYQKINLWFEIFNLNAYWNTVLKLNSIKISFLDIITHTITLKNIETLTNKFFPNQLKQTETFIGQLYQYQTSYLSYSEWESYLIFVNQYGAFMKYSDLSKDHDNVHEEYKNILKLNQVDIRAKLFSQTIDLKPFNSTSMKQWLLKDCIQSLMEILKSKDPTKTKFNIAHSILQLCKESKMDQDQGKFTSLIKQFHKQTFECVQVNQQWDAKLYNQAMKYMILSTCEQVSNSIQDLNGLKAMGLDTQWLSNIYFQIQSLLDFNDWIRLKLFPNQNGKLKLYDELLRDSDKIDSVYKDLLSKDIDVREALFHLDLDLSAFQNAKMKYYTFQDLVQYLLDKLDQPDTTKFERKLQFAKLLLTFEKDQKQARYTFYQWVSSFYQLGPMVSVNNYNIRIIDTAEKLIVEAILKKIHSAYNCFKDLHSHLFQKQQAIKSKEWLTKLYMYSTAKTIKWRESKIFVDQNGDLQIFQQLSIDSDKIDNIYKDILIDQNQDIRCKLYENSIDIKPISNYQINCIKFKEQMVDMLKQLLTKQDLSFKIAIELIRLFPDEPVDTRKQAQDFYITIFSLFQMCKIQFFFEEIDQIQI